GQEAAVQSRMRRLIEELYPLPRSITGNGLRESLRTLKRKLPDLVLHEVASGEAVFDWTVPLEWNVREARLTAPDGQIIADFTHNNLHLLNYSEPLKRKVGFTELRPHLHSLPA